MSLLLCTKPLLENLFSLNMPLAIYALSLLVSPHSLLFSTHSLLFTPHSLAVLPLLSPILPSLSPVLPSLSPVLISPSFLVSPRPLASTTKPSSIENQKQGLVNCTNGPPDEQRSCKCCTLTEVIAVKIMPMNTSKFRKK